MENKKEDGVSVGKIIKGIVIFVIAMSFICLIFYIKTHDSDYTKPKSGTVSNTNVYQYYATGLAKKYVEEKLKYPASSTFQPESEMTVTFDASTHKYTVKGYVDAANAFGTKERKYFTVTMEIYESGGKVYSRNATVSI